MRAYHKLQVINSVIDNYNVIHCNNNKLYINFRIYKNMQNKTIITHFNIIINICMLQKGDDIFDK